MSNNREKTSNSIRKIIVVAVFAAMAYVIHFVRVPVSFLSLDFKDVIMTIAGMYFGPAVGALLSVLVPLLEYPTSETGLYGLIMNILSSGAFVIAASLIYKFKKTFSGAIVALCSACMSMIAVMILANLIITPYYMSAAGITQHDIVKMIPTLLLPFNAVKAVLNASFTLCLYKPVSRVLKRSGFGTNKSVQQPENNNTLRSVLVWIIGGAIAIAALCIIFFVLGGKITFK